MRNVIHEVVADIDEEVSEIVSPAELATKPRLEKVARRHETKP
ncbi:hypothetical protein [Mesorhizobium sp. M0296]